MNEKFMIEAIKVSRENLAKGGGPFGAVIVKDGEIIASSGNSVTIENDPTAHAEVNAIRKASQRLGTYDLRGCEIYSSCEPCPMCLGAIYWARIDKLYFSNTRHDAKSIGFDDSLIYDEINIPIEKRKIPTIHIPLAEAQEVFKQWELMEDKNHY